MWKLRSMVLDAERQVVDLRDSNESDGLLFKMRTDPRVTPVGRVLRRTLPRRAAAAVERRPGRHVARRAPAAAAEGVRASTTTTCTAACASSPG